MVTYKSNYIYDTLERVVFILYVFRAIEMLYFVNKTKNTYYTVTNSQYIIIKCKYLASN